MQCERNKSRCGTKTSGNIRKVLFHMFVTQRFFSLSSAGLWYAVYMVLCEQDWITSPLAYLVQTELYNSCFTAVFMQSIF